MVTNESILKLELKDKDIDNFKSMFEKLNKPSAGYNNFSFSAPEVKLINRIHSNLDKKKDE